MLKKLSFWINSKRLGPDMPITHIMLHSKRLGKRLCENKFAQFGEGSQFRVGAYAVETKNIAIGKHVVIRPGTMLFASPAAADLQIIIEDYVLIGSGVQVYVSNHSFNDTSKPIYFQGHDTIKKVRIKAGCWIGANTIILPGVTIGKNSVIGAGSIVTKDIPDNCVVVGCPARVIKEIS